MDKAVPTTSCSSESIGYTESYASRSLRLSRIRLASTQTGSARTSSNAFDRVALESVVDKLQQSGVPGPLMLVSAREYLGQGSQFVVYKQSLAVTQDGVPAMRWIAAKQPKFDLKSDIRLSLSDETVRRHLNDIYLELHALTTPALATHPNITHLFGWSFDADSSHSPPVLIMELAETNLLTLLADQSSMISEDTKYFLCRDVGAGLDALHDHSIVHGDLKPENVLIFSYKGRPTAKLADFGLSINESEAHRQPQVLGGTRGWMAPEVEARTALEPKAMVHADNYSFGLLAWSIALYYGQPPPSSDAQSLSMIAEGELRHRGETSHHPMYSILVSAVKSLLQLNHLDRPSRVSLLLGAMWEDGYAATDSGTSDTLESTFSAEEPGPYATFRHFPWELPAFSRVFLNGLYTRLVDSPRSLAPELLFSMFLAFSLASLDYMELQEKALEALITAAVLGYEPAQAVARRAYAFYQRSPPPLVEDRFAEWELEASATGSPLAQIDLYQQSGSNYINTKRYFQAGGGYNAHYSDIDLKWPSNGGPSHPDGYMYIHWLATHGNLSQMQEHLNMTANSNIDSLTDSGETPLYLASARGHYAIVVELLNRGADAAVRCTYFGISPLHWLFAFDIDVQSTVVGLLVDGGADLDARTAEPLPFLHFPFLLPAGTPLHWAVVTSSHTAILPLIEHGADVQVRDGSDPYMWDERVRVLNKWGGPNQEEYSFSERETQGLSALDHAAAQHDAFIFEALLATGREVNMNAVDEEGFSVFHRLSTSHVQCTRMGNRFTVRPFFGSASEMQKRLEDTASAIKTLGGDVNLLTTPNISAAQLSAQPLSLPSYTPLMLASINGSVGVLKVLLENGAMVEMENNDGETAALSLCESAEYTEDDLKLECLELLVSAGADINHRSKAGITPIIRASSSRLIDVVDYCLSVGVSIDERAAESSSSHPRRTMLQLLAREDAAFQDSEDLAVLRLLEKHVFTKSVAEQRQTIDATDDDGETILHTFSTYGMLHSIQALLTHGASVNALKNEYVTDRQGDDVYKIFWQQTSLDCAIDARDQRKKKMERDMVYSKSEFQNLADRDESVIRALIKAGGVQASKDRGRKPFMFDLDRYPKKDRSTMYFKALRRC